MKIVIDTHAHTLVSGHAYSTIREMAAAAAEHGMEALALTEHAPAMPGTCGAVYFQNFAVIPRTMCGIEMLFGAEVNILDPKGNVDLPEEILKKLDIVIASIHWPCYGKSVSREDNTQAYMNALHNPYIDIIGHPDDGRYPVDFERLVKTAKETKKLLEVNNSSLRPDGFRVNALENVSEMLEYCRRYEVPVVLGSDAHIDVDAGLFPRAAEVLERLHFPEELVVNTSLGELKKYLCRYRLSS